MSLLFSIKGKAVFPNEETLLIEPFKSIWNRDKSKDKNIAIQEFAYIEFTTSMLRSNPYREYPDDRKEDIVKKELFGDDSWQPDSLILEAKRVIDTFQEEGSISYRFWLANKTAIEKMIKFFNNFDINERDYKTGKPIYKPRDITSAVGEASKTLETITNLKSKVNEEIYESNKIRGGKEISPFAKNSKIKM